METGKHRKSKQSAHNCGEHYNPIFCFEEEFKTELEDENELLDSWKIWWPDKGQILKLEAKFWTTAETEDQQQVLTIF